MKISKYANPDIDRAIPELIPEVIASRANPDRKEQEILCVRLRHHWNGMARKGLEPRHHPTQKPLEVIQWAIQLAGDVGTILDPWAGSGTTGHAAKNLGKRAVLIEREERYCEVAARRLAQDVLPLHTHND